MEIDEFLLTAYLKDIHKISLLTPEKEKEISILCNKGDKSAREKFIMANLRLVIKIAKKYIGCGLPLMDLIEEGNLGLLKAVERFDPKRNCRFSTYATCWIKHTICRALSDKNQVIRIPLYMKKLINRCRESIPVLRDILGRTPTIREVIQHLKIPDGKQEIVEKALVASQFLESVKSLNAINEDRDIIEDPKLICEKRKNTDQSEFEVVEKILASMEPKKVQIINMRFGLHDSRPMTLKEVGERLHLTKERVRQIEKETLKKLQFIIQKNREVTLKRRQGKFSEVI